MARKVRSRIGRVLAFAKAQGWRTDALPDAHEMRSGPSCAAGVMKMSVGHVVTLCPAAVALLESVTPKEHRKGLIFVGRNEQPLSDMVLTKIMRQASRTETVHGFRSAFRDFAAERMSMIPATVAEMALAHKVDTATEQAYLLSDMRKMRRVLMDGWGCFVAPSLLPGSSNVVKIVPYAVGAVA